MAKHKSTRYTNVFYRGEILYYAYRDESRKRVEVRYGTGTPKAARNAQEAAQERADGIRAGQIDPREEAIAQHARRPIGEMIAEYVSHVAGKSKDGSEEDPHPKQVRQQLTAWAEACKVERLIDADPAALARFLREMDASARTRNFYRSSVLGLCRWAADFGRIPRNPIPSALIARYDEDSDRREISRVMRPNEVQALLAATTPERRAYYLIAALCGVRWSELTRILWGGVDLEDRTLTIEHGDTKNRNEAVIPLPQPVVEALRAIRPLRVDLAKTPVFATKVTPLTWRKDLVRAGLATLKRTHTSRGNLLPQHKRYAAANLDGYENDRGEQLDRKCLRTTFGTWLSEAGVSDFEMVDLMRHSDPRLTKRYVRTSADRQQANADRLTTMLDGELDREAGTA
jgi:integrase